MSELRARLRDWIESARIQRIVMTLIVLNAITLGLETSSGVMAAIGPFLRVLDKAILAAFTVEIAIRVFAHGARFFRGGWNWFDLIVVAIALVPASGPLSVLRALRVLRVLRLISIVPAMRSVVEALLRSMPGMSAILALLLLVFYVFAVMGTKLFGQTHPEQFGSLGATLLTLFQLMTLDGWSGEIVKPVLEDHPGAMLYFLPFILMSTFVVLNLFIALIVESMTRLHAEEKPDMAAQIAVLTAEVRALRETLGRDRAG
ncbi:MAG: ion transporter [Tagaea sp.]|nr:ion transporter [Tagaea sp.]